jgi:hypothetical protein
MNMNVDKKWQLLLWHINAWRWHTWEWFTVNILVQTEIEMSCNQLFKWFLKVKKHSLMWIFASWGLSGSIVYFAIFILSDFFMQWTNKISAWHLYAWRKEKPSGQFVLPAPILLMKMWVISQRKMDQCICPWFKSEELLNGGLLDIKPFSIQYLI